jgi:3-deoxy-7-phosphoheptulonate synthase
MKRTSDLRIRSMESLVSPRELVERYPLSEKSTNTVVTARDAIKAILRHQDQRLLAVVGPCSIHDREAALEYASRLRGLAEKYSERMLIVMRVYFEKPRTTVGWRGLKGQHIPHPRVR